MKKLSLNKPFEVLVKSPILIGVVMIQDLYNIAISIFNENTFKTQVTMSINYFDFIVKLLMAIALVAVFRQYYSMKKQQKINELFNQVMFEKTFRIGNIMATESNQIITEIKDALHKKVEKEYGNEMTVEQINNLVNEYFKYNTVPIDPLR